MLRGPKGVLVVGQSGGPTAVINASLAGVLREASEHEEIERVYGLMNGIEGALAESMVDLTASPRSFVDALRRTPAAVLGSCRKRLRPEDYERLALLFQAHNVRYFLYAGGNDSMDTALQIQRMSEERGYELRAVGIPKTVDNDLPLTDHCPGYGSMARFVAISTRDSGLDQAALKTFVPVLITEVMGRHAGWIAASSVLAKTAREDAPHLVYVPERAFVEDRFVADVVSCHRELGWVSVVVCEGIRDAAGELLGGKDAPEDAFGHKAIPLGSGVAQHLARLVHRETGLQTRVNRPGTVARSLSEVVSSTDRAEAEEVGRAAVRQATEGEGGFMITLERQPDPPYRCRTGLAHLSEVANAEKLLPEDFIVPEGNFIENGFRDYALPLIGAPILEVARLPERPVAHRLR